MQDNAQSISVTHDALQSVPWQITGNHWLSLPCVHPADASLHALGVLHRGARAAVEFAGSAAFLTGTGPALARPVLERDGARIELGANGIVWERALHWLPTFTCSVGDLVIRGTVFAPFGQDADIAGACYAIAVDNKGTSDAHIALSLEGALGHRQLRVVTPRPLEDGHRVTVRGDVVILDGAEPPGHVALAIAADGAGESTADVTGPHSYRVRRPLVVPAGGRSETAFYIGAGPERDGACATVEVLRRRGWKQLLTGTRDAIRTLEQTTGMESVDSLINRNMLFAYFYGVGRALDDAHFYLVRSRAPWCTRGVTIRDWEALAWTVPAVQLGDPPLARELILRACEIHGYAPGRGVHYFDGTLFEPGFTLEGCSSYAIAVERYIRDTGDDQIVEEPILADTLYHVADDLDERRDDIFGLYKTEVSLSGAPAPQPFMMHGNAVVAAAIDALKRTLAEEDASELPDPDTLRSTIKRSFTAEGGGKPVFVSASDLGGQATLADDPLGSLAWLPLFEGIERSDPTYRRTAKETAGPPGHLARQIGRLFGPDASKMLEWLRRAPLDHGLAAEFVDEEGKATSCGGDAALSGLLAYAVWFTVQTHGVRP
jgi:hypothetical protein